MDKRGAGAANPSDTDAASARAELAAAEDLVGFGTWHWQVGSRMVSGSEGFRRLLQLDLATCSVRSLLRRLDRCGREALIGAVRKRSGPTTIDIAVSREEEPVILAASIHWGPTGLWGAVHDVTVLRQTRDALERTQSRWEMALETASQGAWDSDLAAGTVVHSRTWRRIRGLHPDGDPRDTHEAWQQRVHPDDLAPLLAAIEGHKSGSSQSVALEYREQRVDGKWIWISSLGRPVEWFPDGRPSRIVGTDTDITARKQAEAQLQRLSQRLELALDVSGLGIFEANLLTREVYWDKRVRSIYGIGEDEPVDPMFWERSLHPDDYHMAMKRVWNAVEMHGLYQSDFRIVRPNGELRHLHTVGTWYRDADGVPKILGVNWDVTDEVHAKMDLERARALAEARNVELEAAKASIEYNALHDALTGLPNRRYLDQHLLERARGASDTGAAISVLHIDLDLFKQINDTLGHAAGDAMLVHVAELLQAAAPGSFVARVGGDEFCIVTSFAGGQGALSALAEDIICRIRRPVPFEGHYCRFGASIGIAARSGTNVDPDRLLIDADIALYRAKGRGKNRYEFFTDALQAEAVSTKLLADDIMRGLEQDEFFPFYQPLFDAQNMAFVAVEALARWRHPRKGILPPAAFLKTAEDLNAVTAIDRRILEKALAQAESWRDAGLDIPSVSVNVSFRRLHDQQLLQHLRELDIKPGTLAFELLESIFLDDLDDIARFNIDQIRDMGIDINIDDFGTGHASIIGLLKLRPNRFKLDRAFLENLTTSPTQRRLVGSIIDIGKSLNIKVVAEGVESIEQAHMLRELGCDILQGFAFARPMPAEELESFLRLRAWRRAS